MHKTAYMFCDVPVAIVDPGVYNHSLSSIRSWNHVGRVLTAGDSSSRSPVAQNLGGYLRFHLLWGLGQKRAFHKVAAMKKRVKDFKMKINESDTDSQKTVVERMPQEEKKMDDDKNLTTAVPSSVESEKRS